jgi:predicted transposase/invertase (TIGR01784 family)
MTGKAHEANETTKRTPVANRKFKDTVFRMLFSDKEALLSLYNAVNNSHYTDSGALEIVTLENAIYMGMKNDLAFILDMNLYLYEHQSTMNPNIPLRDLFYIAAEYQKLVDKKSLYSSALQKIPNPHFIVFYNGSTLIDDCYTSRLSDAFYHTTDNPSLELIVTTFNVNAGHNTKLMSHCQILKEYSIYVAKVRSFAEQMPLDDAVQKAVTECIQENILADFLRKNQAEVIAMSIFEYDKVEEEKKLRKAEFDAGVEQGLKQASTDTALRLLKTGKFDAKEIAKLCNLSIEEVNQLNNQK